jgi:hypothetical protein
MFDQSTNKYRLNMLNRYQKRERSSMKRFLRIRQREVRRAMIRSRLQIVLSNLSFSLLYYRMMNLRKKEHDPS